MGGAPLDRAAEVLGTRARRDVPLGPLTTYRVGGPAALFVVAEGKGDLRRVGDAVRASGLPVLVVGRGSNLLVADGGFPGIAVVLGEAYAGLHLAEAEATAGGALALPVLARRTAAAGLRGLEWAVGVPGSVGGAVRMNAGGHGSDVAATLVEVRVADLASGQDETVPAAALELGYRRSAVTSTAVVVEARFGLAAGDPEAALAEVADIVRWRRAHQPGGQNAGSVFTNPQEAPAGKLVEEAGCRGLRQGTATVSAKHANFIQADPDGSADDVVRLVAEVRRRVRARSGVTLQPELRLVGFTDGLVAAASG